MTTKRLVWDVLVPTALVAALFLFVWDRRHSVTDLWEASAIQLVLIFILVALAHFVNSAEFWLFFRALGLRISILENWMLFAAGQLMNHLPAKLGTLYRLNYMRAVYHSSYATSTAVHGANVAITMAGAAGAGFVGLLATATTSNPVPWFMFALFGAAAMVAFACAVIPLPRPLKRVRRLTTIWMEFRHGFGEIRARPRLTMLAVMLEVIKYLLTAWRLKLAFGVIGVSAPLWLFLVLAAATGIAGFIALTPAALGFREALITGAAAGMGLDATSGLLGATVDRAAMFVVALILGGIGLLVTYPRLRVARKGDA